MCTHDQNIYEPERLSHCALPWLCALQLRLLAHLSRDPSLQRLLRAAGPAGDVFCTIAAAWLRNNTCASRHRSQAAGTTKIHTNSSCNAVMLATRILIMLGYAPANVHRSCVSSS